MLPQDSTHSYKDHVTNEKVRAKIQKAIGPHEDLLTIVKRRKLRWYCHVSRSSGVAKTILQSTVKGGRRQGRQGKRREDNIREWRGLDFARHEKERMDDHFVVGFAREFPRSQILCRLCSPQKSFGRDYRPMPVWVYIQKNYPRTLRLEQSM